MKHVKKKNMDALVRAGLLWIFIETYLSQGDFSAPVGHLAEGETVERKRGRGAVITMPFIVGLG